MLWRTYDAATTALLALAGFVMFALAIGNAMLRYFFASPLVWGEEISRYAMVWGAAIGVALAYRAGQHIAISLLADAMPRRMLLAVRLLTHLLSLATAAVLAWSGQALLATLGRLEAPSSRLSMSWAYAAILVGGALLAIEALRALVRDVRVALGRSSLPTGAPR